MFELELPKFSVIVIFHKSKGFVGHEELLLEFSIMSIKSPVQIEVFGEGLLRIGFGRSYTVTVVVHISEQPFPSVTVTEIFLIPQELKVN